MGVGFSWESDTLPGHDLALGLPAALEVRQIPVFAVRGALSYVRKLFGWPVRCEI